MMKQPLRSEKQLNTEAPPRQKTSMNLKKELAGLLCLLLALALFCAVSVPVLMPKRHDYGSVWDMYLQEPEDSLDLLVFGSSLAYCDVVPSVIYEETGLTSFVMAGPSQRIPITYRYLLEACKTQSPKAVLIEATCLLLGRGDDSLKVNLTYMPWSLNRLIPTFQEASQEDQPGLLFPLYAYHDRWDSLTPEDWEKGLHGYEPDLLAGYTFLDQASPAEGPKDRGYKITEEVYAENLDYIAKMIDFCKERDIVPVFFLTANINQPSEELQQRMEREITGLGAEFWNFDREFDSLGLDLSTDFFDTLHFNYRGSEKFSRYLGGKIETLGFSASEVKDPALWQERVRYFSERKAEWDGKPVRMRSKEKAAN